MGLRNIVRKYKDYETKELARRLEAKKIKAEAIKRSSSYRSLARKAALKSGIKKAMPKTKGKIKENFTKAIGNPYAVKFPKPKKILKKIKRKKLKRKQRTVIIYR